MEPKETKLRRASVVFALAVLANLMWGSAAPIIKTGYALFGIAPDDSLSQILFAGTRFLLAGVLTVVFGSLMSRKVLLPSKAALPKICVLALFQTIIQYLLFYTGCAHAQGTNVAIATSTGAFFSILVSSLVFRQERLTARKVLGCLTGFAGVVLINLSAEGGISLDMSLAGEGAIILSSVSFAFSNGFTKSFSRTENPIMLCGYQFVLGGGAMILFSRLLGAELSGGGGAGLLVVLHLAMVSAVAFSITSLLVKYNPVSRISVFNFLNPIFGVILSILILGESGQDFGLKGLVALALVCGGVVIVNHSGKKSSDPA